MATGLFSSREDDLASTGASTRASASSDAERHLIDAIAAGVVADFSARPPAQRQLRAAFLEGLIFRDFGSDAGLRGALRIRGAEIVGRLRPLRPEVGHGTGALLFWACEFDGPVDLSGGDYLSLRFVDCSMPAFIGASLTTKADLDLSGTRFGGVYDYECELADVGTCAVHLSNARIGGRLVLSATAQSRSLLNGVIRLDGARVEGDVCIEGARVDGRGDAALNARSMTVGGNVNLGWAGGHRFEAVGEVSLAAARITGDLILRGAKLHNPAGRVLHCEDLRVESVFLVASDDTPFEASGRINFLSATIGGSFFMTSARLAPGPDMMFLGRGGPVALNLQQLRVSNALVLTNIGGLDPDAPPPSRTDPATPVAGWFLLTGAQLNGILDNLDSGWPAPGYLDLEGATYERLGNFASGDLVANRLAWLRRQFPDGRPTAARFRPQPYEELSRVLRRHGQAREADAIAVEKIRMRLAARIDRPWARIVPNLLMLISHHGYSSGRAMLSFVIFVLLGASMYALALWGFAQPFVPFEASPEPVEYVFPFDLTRRTAERGCPGLNVLEYALDVALPVIDLGQDTYCRFAPEGSWRWLWSLLHSLYVVAGAALSAVVVLTLTGVMRRD
jgi:hypothetical protein